MRLKALRSYMVMGNGESEKILSFHSSSFCSIKAVGGIVPKVIGAYTG